jgi:hypothetical protein
MQKTSPRNEDILERGDSRELTSENTGINVHPNHGIGNLDLKSNLLEDKSTPFVKHLLLILNTIQQYHCLLKISQHRKQVILGNYLQQYELILMRAAKF